MPTSTALQCVTLTRIDRGQRSEADDWVIEEQPIALVYNGVSHAVMLATPSDLADFALGFSLSEGIVGRAGELEIVAIQQRTEGWVIEMAIGDAQLQSLQTRRRSLIGNSACGLCGSESLQAALVPAPKVADATTVGVDRIVAALDALRELQFLNQRSGGVHAAALVGERGMLVREDVGRHNALDKLLGARALLPTEPGFLLLSSRASYELVHKAAMAQIGVVVAISAPTAMAIRLAEETGITLIAFARGEQMNVYAGGWRVA